MRLTHYYLSLALARASRGNKPVPVIISAHHATIYPLAPPPTATVATSLFRRSPSQEEQYKLATCYVPSCPLFQALCDLAGQEPCAS